MKESIAEGNPEGVPHPDLLIAEDTLIDDEVLDLTDAIYIPDISDTCSLEQPHDVPREEYAKLGEE